MNIQQMTRQFWPYLRRYWLRIGLAGIVLFVLFQKEISFSMSFGPPEVPRQAPTPSEPELPVDYRTNQRETLTEASKPIRESAIIDRLEVFPNWSGKGGQFPLIEGLQNQEESVVQAFIDRFVDVARTEQQKFGIPASIVLANGLLFSQAGKTEAVGVGNNYFQLGCTTDWQGATFQQSRRCLRGYESAWMSFRDHSYYITTGNFAHLRLLEPVDHHAWAKGLEKAGFGETPHLAEQLELLIERFELDRLD